MSKKQDLQSLEKAYKMVTEMNLGPAGTGLQPVGKPVIITMDMPMAVDSEQECENEEEHDSSEMEIALMELRKIAEYSQKLEALVEQMPSLDGWISSKITLASDYISDVYHRLESRQEVNGSSEDTGMFSTGYENIVNCCK